MEIYCPRDVILKRSSFFVILFEQNYPCKNKIIYHIIFTRIWHKVNFFKAKFNRFEFRVFLLLDSKPEEHSLPYYLSIAGGGIIGFIPFPRVLVLCEIQSVSSGIWTRVAVSISYDDNHYTTGTSIKIKLFIERKFCMWAHGEFLLAILWSYLRIENLVSFVLSHGLSTSKCASANVLVWVEANCSLPVGYINTLLRNG